MPTVLYKYTLWSDTSSARAYHPEYIADHQQMFNALTEYCATTGARAGKIAEIWQRETYIGACINMFNGLLPKPTYRQFRNKINEQSFHLFKMLATVQPISYRKGLINRIKTSNIIIYLYLRLKVLANMTHSFLHVIANNL